MKSGWVDSLLHFAIIADVATATLAKANGDQDTAIFLLLLGILCAILARKETQ